MAPGVGPPGEGLGVAVPGDGGALANSVSLGELFWLGGFPPGVAGVLVPGGGGALANSVSLGELFWPGGVPPGTEVAGAFGGFPNRFAAGAPGSSTDAGGVCFWSSNCWRALGGNFKLLAAGIALAVFVISVTLSWWYVLMVRLIAIAWIRSPTGPNAEKALNPSIFFCASSTLSAIASFACFTNSATCLFHSTTLARLFCCAANSSECVPALLLAAPAALPSQLPPSNVSERSRCHGSNALNVSCRNVCVVSSATL